MNKEQLRAYMVCQKKLHYDSRLYESEMLMEKLEHTTIFQESQIILFYHPLPDEVDTRSLIHKWWKTKTILLPKVSGNNLTLHIYKGTDSVAKGAYGIMEPTTPPFPINNMIDLAVIPGVAFDRRGNRLGRGKGYYDRLLCKFEGKGPYKIGLAFSYQVVDLVPTIETDIKMDVVIF